MNSIEKTLPTANSHPVPLPTEKPTVTFCSYDKPGSVGGPFSWLRRLLPLLRNRGIECRCLFLTHFGGTGPVVAGLQGDGFDCRVVNCHDRTVDQVRWILEQLQENPPDVFVPNLVVSAYHAARWVRAAGIPTVGILHSDDLYYSAIQDEFVFGNSDLRLSSVVCVSRELEQQVRLRRPSDTKVLRIPYGVGVPDSSVTPTANRFRIAYVGRLADEQKRISDTTRALIEVCRAIPEAEVALFGDGPDRANVEIILAAEGLGLPIRLEGNVPNAEIQSRLLQHDVITLLSDYEGLPIALLEAMACGCVPVCLQMRSGIPELVQHEVSGLIVSDRNGSLLAAMKRLAQNLSLRRELGEKARDTVIQGYSQNHSADLWAEQLHQMSRQSTHSRFVTPRRISLPKRNPALESAERRVVPPSGIREFVRKSRMWAGRVRRRIL